MPPKFFNHPSPENFLHQQNLYDALDQIISSTDPDHVTDDGRLLINARNYRSTQATFILPSASLRVSEFTDLKPNGKMPINGFRPTRYFEVATIPDNIGFTLTELDTGGGNHNLEIDPMGKLFFPHKHASRIAQTVVDLVQKLP